ncbi:MAG: 1-acyl-sn-glycerol-3-phosphate acyltransferase [Nannocystaceae bacterium]
MLRLIGRAVYKLRGWQLVGELPPLKKFVIIGAPHTSNWDGVFFLAGVADLGVRLRFLSKPENLRGVRGPLFRYFGAIAVDRSSASNVVADIAAQFASSDRFILALGPEGTRGRRPYWRSGFYHIARAADVPVVPIGIHADARRIIIGAPIDLTGDVRADMDRIRAFYAASSSAIDPAKASPVRLREEVEGDEGDEGGG